MEMDHVLPADIEKRSMEIIREELGEITLDAEKADIIMRVIHTSADFDYARNLSFSDDAVESALKAIRGGCTFVTDTNMAFMGINGSALQKTGCTKACFMADADVAVKAAGRRGPRRAWKKPPKSKVLSLLPSATRRQPSSDWRNLWMRIRLSLSLSLPSPSVSSMSFRQRN